MVLRVQRFEPFFGDMGIDLRCCDVRMTEQHLHDTQVGTVIE